MMHLLLTVWVYDVTRNKQQQIIQQSSLRLSCATVMYCNKATSLSHYDMFWEAHSIKEDSFSKHCGQYLSSNHDSAGHKVHVRICFKSCGSVMYSFILTFNYGFFLIHTLESWNKGNY